MDPRAALEVLAARARQVARGPRKVTTLSDAVREHVRPGSHVHLSSGLSRPQASVYQLLRTFAGQRPGLTVSCMSLAGPYVLLCTEGVAEHAICAFHGDNLPTPGPNPLLQQAYEDGAFTLSSWSILSFTQRLLAGALGLPFMPTRSLRGSSLRDDDDVVEVDGALAVRPLVADVALVHAPAADEFGNVLLGGPLGDGCLGAWGARQGAIVTVERIVPPELVAAHAPHMRLPAERVLAVCETPFGAHPGPLFIGGLSDVVAPYAEDLEFMRAFREACRDPSAASQWRSRWVDVDHAGYLSDLGPDRLDRLSTRARLSSWTADAEAASERILGGEPPRPAELAVIAGARALAEIVTAAGLETLLAGVGLSNLAAWLARSSLAGEGTPLSLMVELGMYGYAPAPGDPLLVSNRAAATATGLGGVMDILGLALASTRSGGVLGAGQVDRHGNINSSRTATGRLLVGSGGSNDVASICRHVVVVCVAAASRLVEEVAYVTAPGRSVGALATQHGLLTREDGHELVLTHVWDAAPHAIARARADCGWDLRVSPRLRRLDDPDVDELELLRGWDPQGLYLG